METSTLLGIFQVPDAASGFPHPTQSRADAREETQTQRTAALRRNRGGGEGHLPACTCKGAAGEDPVLSV